MYVSNANAKRYVSFTKLVSGSDNTCRYFIQVSIFIVNYHVQDSLRKPPSAIHNVGFPKNFTPLLCRDVTNAFSRRSGLQGSPGSYPVFNFNERINPGFRGVPCVLFDRPERKWG